MAFRYSPEASTDLAQIWQYYVENAGIDVARRMIRTIRATIQRALGRFPNAGRLRPELGDGVRSYMVLPYVVFYVAEERNVYVLRVLHSHRDIRAPLMSLLTAS